MADDIKTNDDGQDNDKAQVILADYIVHTPRDRISELTPMPLDQHRPHSLILMLSGIQRNMCKEAVARQGRINKIYAEYHDGKIPVDLANNSAWDIKKLEETNLEKWSYFYKQLRRGYKNELLMSMTTLAQSQLEAEQPESPKEVLERFVKSEG